MIKRPVMRSGRPLYAATMGACAVMAMLAIVSARADDVVTLSLETANYFKVFTFPAGVTASAVALVMSFLVFFFVSWLTRASAGDQLDPDVKLIMEL